MKSKIPKIIYASLDEVSALVKMGYTAERQNDNVWITDPSDQKLIVNVRRQTCTCSAFQEHGVCTHPAFANACLKHDLL